MSYIVQFDSLDQLYWGVSGQAVKWMDELEQIRLKVQTLVNSPNMSGEAANNIRSYFDTIHSPTIGLLSQLISLHMSNCLLYKNDYQSKVDSDLHAVIHEDELTDFHTRLTARRDTAEGINDALRLAIEAIRDIVLIAQVDITNVSTKYNAVLNSLHNLDEQIKGLEDTHYKGDFTNTSNLINSVKTFIQQQMTTNRNYKTDFTVETLANTNAFADMYDAYVEVAKECEEKAESLDEAIENENARVAEIQEEYEERERKAKYFKIGVAVVCTVLAVAVTVCTAGAGGAVGAVLIGAGVSAISGAVTAASYSAADEYVEHGYDRSKYDKDKIITDALKAGATGLVSGAITGGLTAGLGNVAVAGADKICSMVHSSAKLSSVLSPSVVRIGSGIVVGSFTEVTTGVVSRGVGTFAVTQDWEQTKKDAINWTDIVTDAVVGGFDGGVSNIDYQIKVQKHADKVANDINAQHDTFTKAQNAGLTNIGRGDNGAVDFSNSDYIMRSQSAAGADQPVTAKIKVTGNKTTDRLAFQQALDEQGFTVDVDQLCRGSGSQYDLHLMSDYNTSTNEATVQLVKRDACQVVQDKATYQVQYSSTWGEGYGNGRTQTAYADYLAKETELRPITRQDIAFKREELANLKTYYPIPKNAVEVAKSTENLSNQIDAKTYGSTQGYGGGQTLSEQMANIMSKRQSVAMG